MRVGVIDIGSNSVRSLLGNLKEETEFEYIRGDLITTRLGEGISKSGRLSEQAMYRTVKGVKKLLEVLECYKVKDIYSFATSAVREAENREVFLKTLEEEAGLRADVLTGEEEAVLNLLGVETGIGVKDDYLLFDIGGGSTEVVLKVGGEVILKSYPVGALKIKERFGNELDEACCFLEAFWREEASDLRRRIQNVSDFIGIGGTLSALVLLKKGVSSYDIRVVHGQTIDIHWLYRKIMEFRKLSVEEMESLLPFDPGRAYIFLQGSALLFSLMSFFSAYEIKISETDLLWGALVKRWGVKVFKL